MSLFDYEQPKKKAHKVTLFGILADGTRAKAHQAKDVIAFVDDIMDQKLRVEHSNNDIELSTSKGEYTIKKALLSNRYEGVANGIKVHVVLKKIVGSITYWA